LPRRSEVAVFFTDDEQTRDKKTIGDDFIPISIEDKNLYVNTLLLLVPNVTPWRTNHFLYIPIDSSLVNLLPQLLVSYIFAS
jgi:hypothetical protein